MKEYFFAILFSTICAAAFSQNSLRCDTLKRAEFKYSIMLASKELHTTISVSDLKSDLTIVGYEGFNVIGFELCLDCESISLADINCRKYTTNTIRQGDNFLNRIKPGYLLSFSCVVVIKNGEYYKLPEKVLSVVD